MVTATTVTVGYTMKSAPSVPLTAAVYTTPPIAPLLVPTMEVVVPGLGNLVGAMGHHFNELNDDISRQPRETLNPPLIRPFSIHTVINVT